MKRVFGSSEQVIHLWANQSQSDARCGNVFFQGKSIYSYGTHYELGRLITYKGKTVAMINTQGYSVTTSKHISRAFSAVSHMINLGTKGDMADVRAALVEQQDSIINSLFDHFKRLSFRYCSAWGKYDEENVKEFNKTCTELGHKELILDLNPEYIELYNEHMQRRVDRAVELQSPEALAKKEKQQARKEELFKIKIQDEINAWKIGGPLTNNVRAVRPQLIRIMTRIDNGEQDVQTSLGATVPFTEAKALLGKILKGTAVIGDKVGLFEFNNVVNGIVQIGCHRISLDDAKNVFERIGA